MPVDRPKRQSPPQPYSGFVHSLRSPAQTNPQEFIPADPAFAPDIKLLNHSLQLILLQPLPQLPRHTPQIGNLNPPLPLLIEQVERPIDLLPRVALEDALRGDLQEAGVREQQAAGPAERLRRGVFVGRGLLAVAVQGGGRHAIRGEEGDDVGFGQVEAEGFERDFELVVVDVAVFVEVEELELSFIKPSRQRPFYLAKQVDEWCAYSLIDLLPLLLAQRLQHAALLRFSSLPLRAFLPLTL